MTILTSFQKMKSARIANRDRSVIQSQ